VTALFDRYLVVDWSASGRPVTGATSIWIAAAGPGPAVELANPATRSESEQLIGDVLSGGASERILIAVDVGLGYPAGTAFLFGLRGCPWSAVWAEVRALIVDDDRNVNNRFAVAAELNRRSSGSGPFWGCPAGVVGPDLDARRPGSFAVEQFRLTERRLRQDGFRPKSVWQLAYAGSVGSQTLTALPVLERLRQAFPGRLSVWPFEGVGPPETAPGSVVVAEVYPSAFPIEVPAGWVLDAAQVASVARSIAAADRRGELGEWFSPELTDDERLVVEAEEGWVLGPGTGRPVR
jgi:hypothetical protein